MAKATSLSLPNSPGEGGMCGMLTDARPRTRMFSAAIESARPEKPQTMQEKVD